MSVCNHICNWSDSRFVGSSSTYNYRLNCLSFRYHYYFCTLCILTRSNLLLLQPMYLPEHVGIPLGTDDSPKYVVMQMHYDNPDETSGMQCSLIGYTQSRGCLWLDASRHVPGCSLFISCFCVQGSLTARESVSTTRRTCESTTPGSSWQDTRHRCICWFRRSRKTGKLADTALRCAQRR